MATRIDADGTTTEIAPAGRVFTLPELQAIVGGDIEAAGARGTITAEEVLMPPSRQTIHNRKTDCARLQLQLDEAGIWAKVAYSDARSRYVVTRIPTYGDVELIAGRYEVVYAWIRGYLLGRFDAISPAERTP